MEEQPQRRRSGQFEWSHKFLEVRTKLLETKVQSPTATIPEVWSSAPQLCKLLQSFKAGLQWRTSWSPARRFQRPRKDLNRTPSMREVRRLVMSRLPQCRHYFYIYIYLHYLQQLRQDEWMNTRRTLEGIVHARASFSMLRMAVEMGGVLRLLVATSLMLVSYCINERK